MLSYDDCKNLEEVIDYPKARPHGSLDLKGFFDALPRTNNFWLVYTRGWSSFKRKVNADKVGIMDSGYLFAFYNNSWSFSLTDANVVLNSYNEHYLFETEEAADFFAMFLKLRKYENN